MTGVGSTRGRLAAIGEKDNTAHAYSWAQLRAKAARLASKSVARLGNNLAGGYLLVGG